MGRELGEARAYGGSPAPPAAASARTALEPSQCQTCATSRGAPSTRTSRDCNTCSGVRSPVQHLGQGTHGGIDDERHVAPRVFAAQVGAPCSDHEPPQAFAGARVAESGSR
jgi:hypothetical protein